MNKVQRHKKTAVRTLKRLSRTVSSLDRKSLLNWKGHSRAIKGYVRRSADAVNSLSAAKLSGKEQAFFAKRLSFLISAGVPILESLHILRDQTRSRGQLIVINSVISDVSNGQTLSKSFSKFPDMFGLFAVNIIKVGETSGTLSQNLDYLAEELKKRQALRRKVVGALVYPALITVATLGITAFLMLYLFPKIMPVFLSMHMTLPLSTRMVIGVSGFLQHWWFVLIVLTTLAVMSFGVARRRNERFRAWVDRSMLRLPVLGDMSRLYNIANGTRTLGLLLKSGVTLSSALVITSETSNNVEYRAQWAAMEEMVNKGQKISLQLAKNEHVFPHLFTQMVAVGEKSGNLSDTLVYVSEFYEVEMDELTKNLSTLIEPALMIFMGLLIGVIAISIITPIYGITQNLHP